MGCPPFQGAQATEREDYRWPFRGAQATERQGYISHNLNTCCAAGGDTELGEQCNI